jgi:predicted permease
LALGYILPGVLQDISSFNAASLALQAESKENDKEQCNMENIWSDIRYALRSWLRQRVSIAAVLVTIAIAIGASVALFAIVNAVLLRPLPYKNADELVVIWDNFQRLQMENLPAAPAEVLDYQKLSSVFSDVSAFQYSEFNLSGTGEPMRVVGARVTPKSFSMLNVAALAGRVFTPSDNPGNPVVVVSYGLWQRAWGGRGNLVDQSITMNGKSYTVVGIMPKEFQFPHRGVRFPETAEVWVPATFTPEETTLRDNHEWYVIARLKPGGPLSQAQANMDEVASQLDHQYPAYRGPHNADAGWKITVRPLTREVTGNVRLKLVILACTVGFVFFIACVNIANLLLARASNRQSEIAVRAALGASRRRIVQQLLTESMVLSIIGSALGIGLAAIIISVLSASYPDALPRLDEASISGSVLAFTVGIVVLAATLFGIAPAMQLSKVAPTGPLKDESTRSSTSSRSRRFARDLLATFEIAIALLLVIGAGLFIQSFRRVLSVNPGFDSSNVLTFTVTLPGNRYPQLKEMKSFYEQALAKLQATPGVKSASIVSSLPLDDAWMAPFSIQGKAFDPNAMPTVVRFQSVGPEYFHSMGIPMIAGNDFSLDDIENNRPVVGVNQMLAKRFFPNGDALGKQIKLGAPGSPAPWLTIIGVARNVKSFGLDAEAQPEMYLPVPQRPAPTMAFVVRSSVEPLSLISAIRRDLQGVDKDQPVYHITTLHSMIEDSVAPRKFYMLLITVLASISLVLAIVGLFGVIAYLVAQRNREMAIRIALGARPGQIKNLIVIHGLKLALAGTFIGLVAALALAKIVSNMLFDLSSTDKVTYIGGTVIIMALALLATYLPALRITRITPNTVLHHE